MAVLNIPRTGRAVATLPAANHSWTVTAPPAVCWVSIGSSPAGDAVADDFRFARLSPGAQYTFVAKGSDVFISGQSTDPNADVSPSALTFLDVGVAS